MTPCLPWPRTDETLHSDSPLTPTPLPARVPAPRRHRGVSPHPPPMRSCSIGVGRGFCKVIVQIRVTGRTGRSLTPPLSHVGDRPAFRTESPVSQETSRSLRAGIVVCPAEEPPRISFSHGAIQISLPSQNEQAAQSFQTCPLKTYTKPRVWKTVLFCRRSTRPSTRHAAAARVLARRRTWSPAGWPFPT